MKKIRNLNLTSRQILEPEELEHLMAGDSWILANHTWNCGCVKKGDTCKESFTYLVFKDNNSLNFSDMPSCGIYYDKNKVGYGEIYNNWSCDGVYNSNKTHTLQKQYRIIIKGPK